MSGKNPRGAPPGNINALKHGFYSRQLKPSERSDLDEARSAGLSDEIALFRVQIRRAVELGKQAETLDQGITFLRAMAHAFSSLSRLMRTQHYLTSGSGNWNDEIDRALDAVLREMQAEDDARSNSQNPLPTQSQAE